MKNRLPNSLLVATLAFLAGVGPCATTPACAQSVDVAKAARVKAAYLLNFIRYATWPAEAFDQPDSPILLTVVGECEGAGALADVVRRSPPVEGRQIVMQHAPYAADDLNRREFWRTVEQSHLLYVCSTGPESVQSVLEHAGPNVLTVGDVPGFVDSGGMIGFVLSGDRILFQASPSAIQKSRVTLSAKVLKLAQLVEAKAP